MIDRVFYPECWFMVEYEYHDIWIKFKAWRVDSLLEDVENPELESEPEIKGKIKWDGCMDFEQKDHYCGLYMADQTFELIKEIYKYNETKNM